MEKEQKKRLFSKGRIIFYILAVLIFIFVAYYLSEFKKDIKLFKRINPCWLTLTCWLVFSLSEIAK